MDHKNYLYQTIHLAIENIQSDGGPFGAIVVDQYGNIVGVGQNKVTSTNDPTAHAEVQAIRKACENLNTFQLKDCVLYTSCEPCPMCLGAIYWARIEKVYYAADQKLAAAEGFDDQFIYEEINKDYEERYIPFHLIDLEEKNLPFEEWKKQEEKVEY
ncbi:guanine deaminase [Halobacillus andaensis]|uniref:Guanine deaminase n=1 Tax=Halobacillus andaensis TaxID=1176239 RepID=A0A917F0D6_HALAA|nr:nucleoside deaminase [Halobacillus andaensis]MBP2005263.1 guanine deaminase [Halobacillus andaensis]GGF30097.1 guanine deaminase [Halobacillus andaensis]